QNTQEVKKARSNPDAVPQADSQTKDNPSVTSNPAPTARPAQPDAAKNPASAHPPVAEKTGGAASQPPEPSPGNTPNARVAPATLNIRMRAQDDSPFAGITNLHVLARDGSEVAGAKSAFEGETVYSSLPPGTYSIEASAPGFATVRQTIDIGSG